MIKIYPTILYRTPQFPFHSLIESYWPLLKESIADVSPDLYAEIKDLTDFDLHALKPSVAQSLWKYMNRCRYRCTPYGTLASFGTMEVFTARTPKEPILLGEQQCIHVYPDWSSSAKLGLAALGNEDLDAVKLVSNPSYYRLGELFRYLVLENGQFQLSEMGYSEELEQLLATCKDAIAYPLFESGYPANEHLDLKQVVKHLISVQLLYTDRHSNIVGQDFFERTRPRISQDYPLYKIAERQVLSGAPDMRHFRYLPQLVEHLCRLAKSPKTSRLDSFRERFVARYEMREVPLLEVLDPEIGIGYGDMVREQNDEGLLNELTETLESSRDVTPTSPLTQWYRTLANHPESESLDLETLPPEKAPATKSLPNTFSLLCHLSGDQVVIGHLGGCTATALSGRFSLVSSRVETMCRELVEIESKANPHVLFFDLAYQAEGRVDNVNRRASIYDQQLSIFDYDTSDQPLRLNDLMLCVQDGQVVIRSRSLDKRLIPRMASAYNYERSDLPIFCLLCDIQHQQIHTSLWPGITNLAPGLDRYPEIRFRNFILSPRTWLVPSTLNSTQVAHYLSEIQENSCQYIQMGISDQKLHFDLSEPLDRSVLVSCCMKEINKGNPLYLEEWHYPTAGFMEDMTGASYACQLQLSIYHEQHVYSGMMSPNSPLTAANETYLLPGDKWLFLELYAQPQKLEELLRVQVAAFVERHQRIISRYFFIRYGAGGEHLRLRFEMISPYAGWTLLSAFSETFREELNQGGISEIKVGTYRREVERYGADLMDDVEDWFFKDSVFILHTLTEGLSTWSKYHCTFLLIEGVLQHQALDRSQLSMVVEKVRASLAQEYGFRPKSYRLVNDLFVRYDSSEKALPISLQTSLTALIAELCRIVQRCPAVRRKQRLLADLVHMHVNRQFASNQRLHEALIYHFVHKNMQRTHHAVVGNGV